MNKLNLSETERAALWQQRFFEAQAAMEKYLVYKYGYEDLYDYIKFNSDIFSKLQNTNNGAEDLVLRIVNKRNAINLIITLIIKLKIFPLLPYSAVEFGTIEKSRGKRCRINIGQSL
ncbi:hypothetical protein NSS70_05890 [Aeribacillus sp. FSL K6-2848]|uniref:hypothetical protein n=1 Tax=Aeribacillus sp. FSL K6-2848 TaxID=2954612 RepID=UPI0030FB07CE